MRKLTTISNKHTLACLLTAILLAPASAFAEDWEYRWMPYLWTAGIDAELGPPGQTTSADVSFRDYAEFIDAGAALAFEARSDQWSVITNLLWVKLAEDISLPTSTAALEQKQLIVEFGVGYRPDGWEETRIVGGARYLNLDTMIDSVDLPEISIGQAWADPFIGIEWRRRKDKWEYLFSADVGGGVDADLTWAFAAGVAYHKSDRWGITGSYRFLDVDFADAEYVFDGQMEGIQIGLLIKY